MPELPEVETVRRSILPVVRGRKIGREEILTPGVWLGDNLSAVGWQINDIGRRGKYLIFALSRNGQTARLVVHLRMTGRLLLQTVDLPPEKHTHIRLRLDPDITVSNTGPWADLPIWLAYHDPRRFGRFWLLAGDSPEQPPGLAGLGPDLLSAAFNADYLSKRLAQRKGSLKAVLLDQTVLAGLGNIYADEVLFASGLQPTRSAASLGTAEIAALATAIDQVLNRAIACQGTTLRDYADGWNQKGTFQDCLMVYGRAGQPCRLCGTVINTARVAGRSTCWCPLCQPEQPAPPNANWEVLR
jgi:formamidopyrimidine-DNA glycosylase